MSLRTTINYTVMGWPTYKQDVMLAARDLFDFRNELSLYDGLLLRGDKIVIPYSMRKEILDRIHDGHLGITKCRERANQGVWCPGLSKQIQDRVAMCKLCMQKKPAQQSEPLLPLTLPDRPFQRIGVDLCKLKGKHFLVSVDYFSRYIDILPLQSLTSGAVINKMKQIFSQHGIAETVISDNGPQFAAKEFQQFAEEWNFHHATSSPHYPQANGEAERAVRSAKEFLRQNDPHLPSYSTSCTRSESRRTRLWSSTTNNLASCPTNAFTSPCKPRSHPKPRHGKQSVTEEILRQKNMSPARSRAWRSSPPEERRR